MTEPDAAAPLACQRHHREGCPMCLSPIVLDESVALLACTCEPHVWDDGSVTHEDDCDLHPWCPHEMGAYVCGIPCGCRCNGCTALALGHAAFEQARASLPEGEPS